MKLNCKAGDLAVVINASSEIGRRNIGRIVEVLEIASPGVHHGHTFGGAIAGGDSWVIKAVGSHLHVRFEGGFGGLAEIGCTKDRNLRPIRDRSGDDETLLWAGLPRYTEDPEQLKRLRESLGVPA